MKIMIEKIRNFIRVSSSNLEDARRRNLLNILLVGSFVAAILANLILVVGIPAKFWKFHDAAFLIVFFSVFLIIIALIFQANRRQGRLAIYLFLALLIIAYTFSDSPANISNGSTVFAYAIPIVMASLLVQPLASFIVAAIGCGIIAWANNLAAPVLLRTSSS
jgi:hypothetical protein